mgnify:CR=1 FL=1
MDFTIPGDGIVLDMVTVLEVTGMIRFSGIHFMAQVIGVPVLVPGAEDLARGVAVLHTAHDGAGVTTLASDLDMEALEAFITHIWEEDI